MAAADDLWSERDTTPDAIEEALRELLRERHAENQALAPARVLNLVLPPGWLPLGAAALAEGDALPALLGTLGLGLIGSHDVIAAR